jgi:hypothetical protein
VKKVRELSQGKSRADSWPDDAHCKMSDDYPKDIELADNMNAMGKLVVSGALKAALDDHATGVEFLPITVFNHKGRVASDDYWAINPVGSIDCIDRDASGAEYSPLKPDLITDVKRLVIEEAKVPADAKIFRPKFMAGKVLIDVELAASLEETGFSGLSFRDPEAFTGT